MRAALFQGPAVGGGKADMLAALARAAAEAAAAKADLLALPEMFLTGYNIGLEATHAAAEPADGPSALEAAAIVRAGVREELVVATIDGAAAAGSRALNTYLWDRLPRHYDEAAH